MKKAVFILFACFLGLLMFLVSCVKDFGLDSTDSDGDDVEISDEGSDDTVSDQEDDNAGDHDDDADYVWSESDVVQVILNGSSISTSASGASVNGSTITIIAAGTYSFSGSLTNGRIIVNTDDEEIVRLILNGVNITCSSSAPIYGENSDKIMIVLADGTENYITDGSSYTFDDSDEDEPNAAVFSKDDLTLYGEGSLTIDANYNDAIASKDGLILANGTININSVDDGIRGKDYLIIKKGNITIEAEGDGLKSDNDEDETKGYITITEGSFNITTGGDGITAQTDVLISDGEFTLKTGNGSSANFNGTESMKGIKAAVGIVIDYAVANINSADDAIHSNGSISINGGTYEISTGDDGIHADNVVGINGGDYNITKSYEGIESAIIKINAGDIHIISSDDGLNVAGGNDNSGDRWGGGGYSSSSSSYYMLINDGYIYVEASGDGLDANGSVEMTGGTVIVNGPTSNNNGALDYDGSFKITGGTLVAAGSSGMAQAPGSSSSQYSVMVNFSSTLSAGKLIHIETSSGDDVITFTPTKSYSSFVYSSPELAKGASYNIYYGGNSTGTLVDGIYSGGTYTSGTKYTSFSISGVVTTIGSYR